MANRGRKPKQGIARAAAPNLNLRSLKATRMSAGGKMPVHFKQVAFKRDGRAVAGLRKRQDYIERDQAAEPVDLAALEKSGLAKSAERFVGAGDDAQAARASFGTLGQTPEERRAFWAQIEALERANARVQYGIIGELPHEVSQAGRLEIMKRFCASELEPRALPYWATAHRPDAHNDPRNFHVHILYYGRPGRRTEAGWRFDASPENTASAPIVGRRYPWGTEKPSDRIKRLTRRLDTTQGAEARHRLAAQLKEAREVAADRANRTRPTERGGPTSKSQREYPWGVERPTQRKRRLAEQSKRTTDRAKLEAFHAKIAEVDAYLASQRAEPSQPDITVRDRDWVAHLRGAWCAACNAVLEKEGHAKRYHPGGYKDLGIDAEPTAKLGTKAAALEARGIVTAAGRDNTETVLRQLLKAGIDIDAAAATAAAETIGRRAAWAANERAEAEKQANTERAAYWRREEATARSLASAITERVETTAKTASHIIFADRLREILKISSALPVPEEPASTTISVRADTSALAAALAARMSPEALADTRDPFAAPHPETPAPLPQNQTAPAAARPAPTEPAPASPRPDKVPAPTPAEATPAIHPYDRDEVVRRLLGREAAAEQEVKDRPTKKAFRVRPDVTVEERQAIRAALMARNPSENRLAGRHTRNAIDKATNPYEKAALKTGLQTLGEAYALAMAGTKRASIIRQVELDDTIRGLEDRAREVRIYAAQLAIDLPQLHERVTATAKERGSAEDMVAIDGGLALQKLREKSKPADQTAASLQTAIRGLEEAYDAALKTGARNGGYLREHKLALTTIAYKTSTAVAWVPPLPDDPRTLRRRAENALHAGRLPIPFVRKKPNLKERLKRDQEWNDEQNHKKEIARQKAAAAKADAVETTPIDDNKPGMKARQRATGPVR